MKTIKKYLIKTVAGIIVIAVIFFLSWLNGEKQAEINRLKQNQTELLTDAVNYKFRDSLNAQQTGELLLSKQELINAQIVDKQRIADLNKKVGNLKSYSQIKTETQLTIADTVFVPYYVLEDGGEIDTCRQYKDNWNSITICPDSTMIDIRNDIQIFAFWKKTKCLFPKIKGVEIQVVSNNPKTKINETRFISVKEKK